jgi:hypothetical protein
MWPPTDNSRALHCGHHVGTGRGRDSGRDPEAAPGRPFGRDLGIDSIEITSAEGGSVDSTVGELIAPDNAPFAEVRTIARGPIRSAVGVIGIRRAQ